MSKDVPIQNGGTFNRNRHDKIIDVNFDRQITNESEMKLFIVCEIYVMHFKCLVNSCFK